MDYLFSQALLFKRYIDYYIFLGCQTVMQPLQIMHILPKMNIMKKILILIISMALFISCSNDTVNDNLSQVNIRLSNVSDFDFHNIIVDTTTGNVHFGDVSSGQKTDYKVFQVAYRYAFVELEIDGETYTLQPIDYFGETPLEDGNYSYEIDANDSQEQFGKLSLTLVEE